MIYNLEQILSQAAQLAGIQDTNGNYAFDDTTFPTSGLAVNWVNDSIREITGAWDYRFLETSKSYPFYHAISGVQALYLSGTSSGTPISGVQVPYPSDVLNYAWTAQNQLDISANDYVGITFTGTDSGGTVYTGVSTYGEITTANWTGVGYTYQLDADIDKFLAPGIVISHSENGSTAQGIICQNTPMEDLVRLIPIGFIQASGTPSYFTEFPGLSSSNNNGKMIQFFPFPLSSYSGNNFIVPYKKQHVDMTSMSEQQRVVPQQWQQVIIEALLEKISRVRSPEMLPVVMGRKEDLIAKMKVWDANQPSMMWRWRDYNYNSRANSAYDNSTWIPLNDSSNMR
jgi:hypothetical protein